MNTSNPPPSPDVQALLSRIRGKTDLIVKQQAKADAGEFANSMGAAMGLQRLRRERKELQGRLPELRLAQ